MKRIYTRALVAFALLAGGQQLTAQTFTITDTQLLLVIRKADNTGSDFEVNLGNVAFFKSLTSAYNIPTYSSGDFSGTFSSANNLSFAVMGRGDRSVTDRTVWLTLARTDVNTQSTPFKRASAAVQSTYAGNIQGITDSAVSYSPAVRTNLTVIPQADLLSYNTVAGTSGQLGGTFGANIENTTPASNGWSLVRSDLYESIPQSTNPKSNATYIGSFDFRNDGTMQFIPASAISAPPLSLLKIAHSGANALVSWDAAGASAILQSCTVLATPTVWTNAGLATNLVGSDFVATAPIVSGGQRFFRLLKSP